MQTYSRRDFIKKTSWLVPSVFLLQCSDNLKESQKLKRPNIIFIMADDMGYGDLSCYNKESKIPTVNIDRLANQGIRFTNAHAPAAWCVPTRYGLLTGRYPFREDMKKIKKQSLLEPDRINIASLLQSRGYDTACVGKWHLGFDDWENINYTKPLKGGPVDRGFNYFFGIHASLDIPPYFYIENDRCLEPPTEDIEASYSSGVRKIQGAFWREGKIAPNFKHEEVLPTFTDKACQFLQNHNTNHKDDPFFLYFALPAPHTPWLPLKKYVKQSQAGDYGDYMVQVDHSVGRILSTLEGLKIEDNTLVIFTSDNGPVWFDEDIEKYDHRSSHFLRGIKSDSWEGGHRMPFIARWPGKIEIGSVTDETICFTDMLATFAAVAHTPLPENGAEDSYNILPALTGKKSNKPIREATIIGDNAIIKGQWKLIIGSGAGWINKNKFQNIEGLEGELYNIQKDPSEKNNLYIENPTVVTQLTALLDKYKQSGRSVPR